MSDEAPDGETDRRIVEVPTTFGRLLAFDDDLITQHLLRYGAHTRTDLAFLLSAVQAGDRIFDLGAHIGTFTIPLAEKTGPTGKVLAVEGSQEAHRLLSRNIELNGCAAYCTAVNCLVVADSREYLLVRHSTNTGASYCRPATPSDEHGSTGRRLSELVEAHFVPRIVKLDIEGFELAVLREVALQRIGYPIVFLEVSEPWITRAGGSISELDSLLLRDGYQLFWNSRASHAHDDRYAPVPIARLRDAVAGRNQLNVLAIHEDDPRMPAIRNSWGTEATRQAGQR